MPHIVDLGWRRIVKGACDGCGLGPVYCDCTRDLRGEPCCPACSHRPSHTPLGGAIHPGRLEVAACHL